MATLSHEAFRRLIARFGGCDEYFTEMINAPSLLNAGPWEKFYLMAGPEPQKIVWQLTGNDAHKMGEAAKILASLDGIGIDINMGCSAPQIAKTGAGIAWMLKDIRETERMVRLVKKSIEDCGSKKRLSVKLRLGSADFSRERLFDFCKMLLENGVQMLTLHPRTQKQKFREKADWTAVEDLAHQFPKIPVILNGDVTDVRSFQNALLTAPSCAGVMIARAAAQKPWIFAELSGTLQNTKIDMEALALSFIDDVETFQPEEFWKTRLQRFFAYFCTNFSFAHYFQTLMLNARNNDDARNRIKFYFFFRCPSDKIKLFGN